MAMAMETGARIAPGGAYGRVAKWLHWITVGLMAVALPMGFVIQHIKDAAKMPFYAIHESAGLVIFAVVLLRLVWKQINPPPPLDPAIPRPMRVAAAAVHHTLYALLLIQPLLGFVMTNAFGFPMQGGTAFLGVIDLPKFMEPAEALANTLKLFHTIGGWSILVLLALHIGGAVFHQAIRRDETLLRMV
jgi:cytochrome b561